MSVYDELRERAERGELTPGQSAPDGLDGYIPGPWDDAIRAFLDDEITAQEYESLRAIQSASP